MYKIELWILTQSRRFFVFIGALAIVCAVLGVLALIVGGVYYLAAGPKKGNAPAEPTPPPQIAIADLDSVNKPEFAFENEPKVPSVTDEEVAAMEPLKQSFRGSKYSWESSYREVCRSNGDDDCAERVRKLQKHGIAGFAAGVFKAIEVKDVQPILEDVMLVLELAPMERRPNVLVAAIIAAVKRQQSIKTSRENYESAKARVEAEFQQATSEFKTKVMSFIMAAAIAFAASLSTALAICMFVAVLSIERCVRQSAKISTN